MAGSCGTPPTILHMVRRNEGGAIMRCRRRRGGAAHEGDAAFECVGVAPEDVFGDRAEVGVVGREDRQFGCSAE